MRAYIVDDLKASRDTLIQLLRTNCPSLEIVGDSGNIDEAILEIKKTAATIIFLDINLGNNSTGFKLLDAIPRFTGDIVIVTAYEEYALKSFQYGALHYLLKPIDPFELTEAISRILQKKILRTPLKTASNELQNAKIAIPIKNSIEMVSVSDIIYLEGDGSYTKIFLREDKMIRVAKNLKHVSAKFDLYDQFIKVQKSYIVNKDFITGYIKGGKNLLILDNKYNIPVSPSYKEIVFKRLNFNFNQPNTK